jgi:hypothetical protein
MLEGKRFPQAVEEPKEAERDAFKDISRRLESNLRKIESIEQRQEQGKQNVSFKLLKHNLLSGQGERHSALDIHVKG